MKYAAETEVPSEKSQAEIKTTLQRYGAMKYAYYEDEDKAGIRCEIQGRQIQFIVTMPDRLSAEFVYKNHSSGKKIVRDVGEQHKMWEKACRQRWRALALVIKAKLEAVESGIATFEQEFLDYILLPDGQTVGDYLRPQLEQIYSTGKMPRLLPGIGETGKVM